jgi:hypothetical protein
MFSGIEVFFSDFDAIFCVEKKFKGFILFFVPYFIWCQNLGILDYF